MMLTDLMYLFSFLLSTIFIDGKTLFLKPQLPYPVRVTMQRDGLQVEPTTCVYRGMLSRYDIFLSITTLLFILFLLSKVSATVLVQTLPNELPNENCAIARPYLA